MNFIIIDVSLHQGSIDWRKVRPQIDGAIIRIGYRGYAATGRITADVRADYNIKGCIANNIPYGVYFFSQAVSYTEGMNEAKKTLEWLRTFEKQPLLPVFIDTEMSGSYLDKARTQPNGRADNISNEARTHAVLGFLKTIEDAGYFAGVYASTSWFKGRLDDADLKNYAHWVADYRGYNGYTGKSILWQYSSDGAIDGIETRVDMNKTEVNFPALTKGYGLNGYGQVQTEEPEPDPNTYISKGLVCLKIGFASSGDIKAILNAAAEANVEAEAKDGYITTAEANQAQQIIIVSLCRCLDVPVVGYKPIIESEPEKPADPEPEKEIEEPEAQEEPKEESAEEAHEEPAEESLIIRFIKWLISLFK